MEKVEIENELNLAVYINGKPDLTLMPQEVLDTLCSALLALMDSELVSSDTEDGFSKKKW